MGTAKTKQQPDKKKATATDKRGPSKAFQLGRRLILHFVGDDLPELHRIEFRLDQTKNPTWCQRKLTPHFRWSSVPKALSIFLLEYLDHSSINPPTDFRFSGEKTGSYVASIGNAKGKRGFMDKLFVDPGTTTASSCWGRMFEELNLGGAEDRTRVIWVNVDFLPPDCIQIFWEGHQKGLPISAPEIKMLLKRLRESAEPGAEPEVSAENEELPESTLPPAATEDPNKVPRDPKQADPSRLPKSEAQPTTDQQSEEGEEPPHGPKTAAEERSFSSFQQSKKAEPEESALPSIDERLFTIQNPQGFSWEDSHPLLDLGEDDGSEDDLWRLKDACESVLILGSPSSGKTSSSGFAFAGAFLQAGFGGLVLTAKPDEARRWERLCAHFGRAEDCIVITPNGPHKLNVLAYETQRAKDRLGVTDDLISFFRILIAIVAKRPTHHGSEDFWINSTNQLMRNLFDVFLLAEEPMSIDSLMRFINQAPKKQTEEWSKIAFFGRILKQAENRVRSPEDMRIFKICEEYWTIAYPNIADVTRSGITTGFSAMAATLSGRGIHDLISTDTTLTPESSILSGKIVILSLPLKECGQGGLCIQAAWKYLTQRAIERRADKGKSTAIPVFLWSDEGHLFFSQHDVDFQPTARDCRCSHVVISQNLHNFYQLGHTPHAVQAVFATMSTHVYHANGDLETAKWSSEKLGTAIKTRVNVSISSQPKPETNRHWFWDAFKPTEYQSSTSASTNQHRESIVQPEEFSRLKKGGDGTSEAIVLWVSHRFKANNNLPFCRKIFVQDNINHQ